MTSVNQTFVFRYNKYERDYPSLFVLEDWTLATIKELFPFDTLQGKQGPVLDLIGKLLANSNKFTILQSPVGSGKSAMAIAVARYCSSSHIITPRKQLQDQYFEDFSKYVVLMKGKGSYPCVLPKRNGPVVTNAILRRIDDDLILGSTKPPATYGVHSANVAPCTRPGIKQEVVKKIVSDCSDNYLPCGCPYLTAINIAQVSPHIVHNPYGFLFQTALAKRFEKRPVMIVDECHDLPDIIRGYLSKDIYLYSAVSKESLPKQEDLPKIDDWIEWALGSSYRPRHQPKDPETGLTLFESHVEELQQNSHLFSAGNFSVTIMTDYAKGLTKLTFTPVAIGKYAKELLFEMADKVLLMSGTIYDKEVFCKELGILPSQVNFVDVSSTFPAKNRPIILDESLMVDTSHKNWKNAFPTLIHNIKRVLRAHFKKGENGLIHAPSYGIADRLQAELNRDPEFAGRVVSHTSVNFTEQLNDFYSKPDAGRVFISPVCQQGVDFKGPRARFQIICRVPYASIEDGTVDYMLKANNFAWYNWKALIVFGQQCGRINRTETDYGITYLLDSRFTAFIRKNKRYLQEWFVESLVAIKKSR